IANGDTLSHPFPIDLSSADDKLVEVRAQITGDQVGANDAFGKMFYNVLVSQSSFPYCEDFESGPGLWRSGGTNSSWAHGTPSGSTINAASGGTKAWATNLSGNHNQNEESWLLSPCFDFPPTFFGKITFDIWYETQSSVDGLKLQYSINGGEEWVTESIQSNGHNSPAISSFAAYDTQEGWSGSTGKWVSAQAFISPSGAPNVLYRFVFASDGSTAGEGVAIDNICIFDVDSNPIFFGNGCDTMTVKGVNGFSQFHLFDRQGSFGAYLSPNGNDLGTVTLEVNDMASVPQAANNVFYIPRYFNFTCAGGADCPSSGNFPQGTVTVGFYFENNELNDYNASAGGTYTFGQLNATHFDGTNENCTLNDNGAGTYAPILSAAISSQSYNNMTGFTLEFEANKFSEFGFHGTTGVLQPASPLPLELLSFSGKKLEKSNLLEWQTASEENVEWHVLERSADARGWMEIARLPAAGFSEEKQGYQYEDKAPLQSAYYRLRSLDFSGEMSFSKTISLVREAGQTGISSVFPVPTEEGVNVQFQVQEEGAAQFQVSSLTGQVLFSKNVFAEAGANSVALSLEALPAGVYFLQMKMGNVFYEPVRVVKF
ncbi:MAG TPA: T9SS type A sorting domain-containing protein, partial [Bacteroidetes bacterium]|nr:T9SS type A sorting domain-containing protein [Bacteroidota bacterium]